MCCVSVHVCVVIHDCHHHSPGLSPAYLRRVVSQPVVRLPEIIEDDAAAVPSACGQDDGGTGVGLRRDPGAVEGVHDEEGRDDQHHTVGNLPHTVTIGYTTTPGPKMYTVID